MPASRYRCRILETLWICPSVLQIRFAPHRKMAFEAGQFLSIVVPSGVDRAETKRLYSFASPPESARREGILLCVKIVPGGIGSTYLASLRAGDEMLAFAPYGDFVYHPPAPGRNVCFICTGTGMAPMRSIVLSEHFRENAPPSALLLAGTRGAEEKIYAEELAAHIPLIYALSGEKTARDFNGRVTDYLSALPLSWPWTMTDYYLCGNGSMITQTVSLLRSRGVREESIHKEAFGLQAPPREAPAILPIGQLVPSAA